MSGHLPSIDLTSPLPVGIKVQFKLEGEHPHSFKTFGNYGKAIKSVVGLLNTPNGALVGWSAGRSVVRGRSSDIGPFVWNHTLFGGFENPFLE
ncbi:hypothetical protein CDAR_238241 [Caerostris darwini]|uniref:Uncharacterized protein n=1 Tax=Caerostris darwini TaxID=1538125 RepID=A0AAV4RP21_9ARAC|nr:hypothetical protein CDAR_238241 [Caerostris darwini]